MGAAFLALILMAVVGVPLAIIWGLCGLISGLGLILLQTVRGIRSLLQMLKMIGDD